MYDPTGAGDELRKHVYAGFAYWHTMKMGFFAIWRTFAKQFLAGLFHQLYPKFMFRSKPSYLTSIVSLLTTIRIAYRKFGPHLKLAMAQRDLTLSTRNDLQNLHDLCEFYIPTVHFFERTRAGLLPR
jgi:hypothetical protein